MKKKSILEAQGSEILDDEEDEVFILDASGKSVKLEVPDDAADD